MSWETYEFPESSASTSTQHAIPHTSALGHPASHLNRVLPEYSAPTLSLLPIPRKPELEGGHRKYEWKLRQFKNDARDDSKNGHRNGLKLKHWSKVPYKPRKSKAEGDAEMSDEEAGPYPPTSEEENEVEEQYPFAKYTIKAPVVYSYTDDEYAAFVEDSAESGWTKAETDYLFGLLRNYSARFYIVLDRYDYPGTTEQPAVKREIEDIKDRYYSVVRKLIRARAGDKPEDQKASESLLLSHGFDREQEKTRREHIAELWNRAPSQILEETLLYTELLRLSQTATSFTAERHRLLRLLAGIESGLPDIKTWDDRLNSLNNDIHIRGVKGGIWGNAYGSLPSAGPSATRKKRGGGHASMDWGEASTPAIISLGASSAARQLLPPAQQAEYDAKHCIYRAPPGSSLVNSKNTHTPVHARSSKFPVPKPILASHLQAYSQTSNADGSPSQPQTILAKLDIHPTKLAMPTKENLELMERVFGAATQWVEVQKQLERADAELAVQRKRLGLPEPTPGATSKQKTEEGAAPTSDGTKRKRSMSVSSDGTSASNNKRMKA